MGVTDSNYGNSAGENISVNLCANTWSEHSDAAPSHVNVAHGLAPQHVNPYISVNPYSTKPQIYLNLHMHITLPAPQHFTSSGSAAPMSAFILYPGPAPHSYIHQRPGIPSYAIGQPGQPADEPPLMSIQAPISVPSALMNPQVQVAHLPSSSFVQSTAWYPDSGATNHISHIAFAADTVPSHGLGNVTVGNDLFLDISGIITLSFLLQIYLLC